MGAHIFKRHGGNTATCSRCGKLIPKWPKGGAILENEDGTEEIKVCLRCMDRILNMRGVQVLKDNVNRG